MTLRLIFFSFLQSFKGNKERKKIADQKNHLEKLRKKKENEDLIILALLIRQAALSLQLSPTRITNNFMNV